MPDYDFHHHTGSGKPKGPAGGEPWKRPQGAKPPCHKCPKGINGKPPTPVQERLQILSDRNWRTFMLARQAHATHGQSITEAMREDSLCMENLAIVLALMERKERRDFAEQIGSQVGRWMLR